MNQASSIGVLRVRNSALRFLVGFHNEDERHLDLRRDRGRGLIGGSFTESTKSGREPPASRVAAERVNRGPACRLLGIGLLLLAPQFVFG
jgi:hypothetical protein